MSKKTTPVLSPLKSVDLGENPVNRYQAREYAKESSPSILAVILELGENARDNATDVTLTIEVESSTHEKKGWVLKPSRIICEDNGTGLTHSEFLGKFCGAFSESEAHHEVDRAGRNGVGTKTYTSIAERVRVETTTGRLTQGLNEHRELLVPTPLGLGLPHDGEPDTVKRVYEFQLHTRSAVPYEWANVDAREMGTRVELYDLRRGTDITFEILRERLSYPREWLQNPANSFTLVLSGNVPPELNNQKRTALRAWSIPVKNWLVEVTGKSDGTVKIYDRTTETTETILPARDLPGVVEFDFRVVGRNNDGQMQSLEKAALLLEVSGALPYAPNLEGVLSERTQPFLHFTKMEHASSIGAFYNSVCGWARINSLDLKDCLRNNKTTLASGPGAEAVLALQAYLNSIFKIMHRAWYNATRSSQDEATKDALKEAQEEVNLALKGANRTPFKTGDITKGKNDEQETVSPPPARRHRWECGSCEKRWLAEAGFTPSVCAERALGTGPEDGCGSPNIGLAKNQPRIADCDIRVQQLPDERIPSLFQFEKANEDLDVPVVTVNLASPRYLELRGTGPMSGPAQQRLKQYLVDVSLVAIAEYNSRTRGTDFAEEWGNLYFNRMLRLTGIKRYQSQLSKMLEETTAASEQKKLFAAS
ncbi:MAG: ATP-binding protein [Pyrinomonadaceae bacterium]